MMLNIKKILGLVIICSFILSCKDDDSENTIIPIVDKALNDTSSIYYSDFSHYPEDKKNLPIGVFDGGIKGMMILESFLTMDEYDNITGRKQSDGIPDFAGEKFIYLADIANSPYSEYNTNDDRADYLRELMMKNTLFLMGEDYYNIAVDNIQTGIKEPVKIVVSASCNRASGYGISDVKDFLTKTTTGINLLGTIESSVEDALDGLDKSASYAIGLIAAPNAKVVDEYERTLRQEYAKRQLTGVVQFFSQIGDDFSMLSGEDSTYVGPIIGKNDGDIDTTLMDRYRFDMSDEAISYKKENGIYTDIRLKSPANYARFHLVSLVEKHRRTGSRIPIKSVIMGNMFYPYLLDTLTNVISELRSYKRDGRQLYKETIAKDFRLIDPVESTTKKTYEILRSSGNLAFNPQKSELRAFVSVPTYGLPLILLNANGSLNDKYKYGRVVGSEEITTKILPFSSRYVGDRELKGIESLMPYSFSLIKNTLY